MYGRGRLMQDAGHGTEQHPHRHMLRPCARAADAERRRLERDLHDGAQQRLVALAVQLHLVGMQLESGSEAGQLLAEAQQQLTASLAELRELAHGLHPSVLTSHGLGAALNSLAGRAPVPVEVIVDSDDRLPEPVELAAYFVVAESLTNVAKYAGASSAQVRVSCARRWLLVEVVDDGVGGADPATGSGLCGLRERVAALGGDLDVSSPAGGGTVVRASIPCGPVRAAAAPQPLPAAA
jgi:signal transduction histidine kinase